MNGAVLPEAPILDFDPIDDAVVHAVHRPANQAVTVLDHNLQVFFPELVRCRSTRELFASAVYRRLQPEIERVMGGVVVEEFADPDRELSRAEPVRAVAWNIERGNRLEGIITSLREQKDLRGRDLLLLTELDHGMVRSGNLFIAREIARELRLNFAFAPCYLSLVKGSGVEYYLEGENSLALHGNAIFSRFPLLRAHSVAFPNGKDKMKGKEKRLGNQRAVVADVDHPSGRFRAVSLHLDAHSSQAHRRRQMALMLAHLEALKPPLPVIIGGDWNTSTYNSSAAWLTILGFWRRVMMGVRHVIENHYPYPERWFERKLFRDLERAGYEYRSLNHLGAGTLHYASDDLTVNTNLADWVPGWCFRFLRWAMGKNNGVCSLKLDWFAGKGIRPVSGSQPRVIGGLRDAQGILSDHDPIILDFEIRKAVDRSQ